MKAARCYLTIREVAAQLAVKLDTVLCWVHRGELRAVNVAAKRGGRPRWRIEIAALDEFIANRAAIPPISPKRRKPTKNAAVIEFF